MVIQNWSVAEEGGNLSNVHLSRKFRDWHLSHSALEQFVTEGEPVIGSDKGDEIKFNRGGELSQLYATAPVTELDRLPDTSFAIDQGTLRIDEYGVAVRYTDKLERLSDFNPKDLIQKRLMRHMGRTNNMLIYNAAARTRVKYVPTGTAGSPTYTWDTDGTLSDQAARALQAKDFYEIKQQLVDYYNLPEYDGKGANGNFRFIVACPETLLQTLMQDTSIATALNNAYSGQGSGAPLLSGAAFTWNGFLFVLDNQALSQYVPRSGQSYASECLIFGSELVIRRTLMAPTVLADPTEDLGRFKRIGWRGIFGYGLPWGDQATDITNKQITCVHVTSAA